MRTLLLAIVASLATGVFALAQRPAATTSSAATSGQISVDHCEVRLDEESQVPAQEAGVLTAINVREGQAVAVGAAVAKIEDAQVQIQKKNTTAEYQAAKEKAENDVDIRYAVEAAQVAKAEYNRVKEAQKKSERSVTEVEAEEKRLQARRAELAIEQAGKQKIVDGYTAQAKQAELEMANEAIRRRQITAPIEGVVQKIYPHLGEWVKPGDPVVRVLRMDRLRVIGYLDQDKYSPSEVVERPVSVQVMLAAGRQVEFPGKVVFVDPEIQGEHEYEVRAVVENRKENGQWLLRPGLPAKMTIQLR